MTPGQSHFAELFQSSRRKHVLMITNHGIHQWQVIPGLPDTGGQNVFVNQFSAALANEGFKITIVNRGGYAHPRTGERQSGCRYLDEHQRILYLEDGLDAFVRKEDMHERIPALVGALAERSEQQDERWDLILSHYWDGALLGAEFNDRLAEPLKHIWVPHSLGAIKKRNMPAETWPELHIDERIAVEKALIPRLDGIAATSSAIERSLVEDYGYFGPTIYLPPCVDARRYHPHSLADEDPLWGLLSSLTGLSPARLRERRLISEISRTDATKRKDVLIRAFARVHRRFPDTLLVVAIDEARQPLASELLALIQQYGLRGSVAVVGSIWEQLPSLYAATSIYCTPSVMEGFGMAAQEAAATAVPVVSSDLVPFVTEFLLGSNPAPVSGQSGGGGFLVGQGAIVVPADDEDSFAQALSLLLTDETKRREMGQKAYHITIPYFTWRHRIGVFLEQIEFEPGT